MSESLRRAHALNLSGELLLAYLLSSLEAKVDEVLHRLPARSTKEAPHA